MRRMSGILLKRRWAVIIAAWCAFGMRDGALYGRQSVDQVVAAVNDEAVTMKDVQEYFVLAFFDQLKSMDARETEDTFKKNKEAIINRIIDDRLIIQEAKRMKRAVPDSSVDARVNAIRGEQGGEDTFEKTLAEKGMTLSMVRDKVRDQLFIRDAVEGLLRPQIDVSPKEVADYYAAHPGAFVNDEERSCEGLKFKNKEEAVYAHKRLLSGDTFEQLREKYKDKHMEICIKKNEASEGIISALFSLERGAFSRPVKVGDQYVIFRLVDIVPKSETDLKQAEREIYAKLYGERFDAKMKEWIADLRKKAYIKIYEDTDK